MSAAGMPADPEIQLNDFRLEARQAALAELLAGAGARPPEIEAVNLHCHTFFSYNAYGYSPTGLAWLARQRGYRALGIVDFDVLDAVDEFLDACEQAGVRGSAGMETRVFLPEFASREINSPGEPGVAYHMGIGFTSSQVPDGAAPALHSLRERAEARNREMVNRLNAFLKPLAIDYDRDVLPLTPACNATERHILAALTRASEKLGDPLHFWAEKLGLPAEKVSELMRSEAQFHNQIRTRLMKRGGVGYMQPGPDTFPRVEEVNQLVAASGALPCVAWLDGTSAGEQAMEELLTLMIDRGAAALNVVPDRNWNIADPDVKRQKLENLYAVVDLAGKHDLPVNTGTEMNSPGQKLVDDFDVPELAPVRGAFLAGADFIYGHTWMQRALGLGWQSEWAKAALPGRRERNEFYRKIGRLLPPDRARQALSGISASMTTEEILGHGFNG